MDKAQWAQPRIQNKMAFSELRFGARPQAGGMLRMQRGAHRLTLQDEQIDRWRPAEVQPTHCLSNTAAERVVRTSDREFDGVCHYRPSKFQNQDGLNQVEMQCF